MVEEGMGIAAGDQAVIMRGTAVLHHGGELRQVRRDPAAQGRRQVIPGHRCDHLLQRRRRGDMQIADPPPLGILHPGALAAQG